MPDYPPPMYGWSTKWRDTGRTMARIGLLGLTYTVKEQWRYPFDGAQAPDFRWTTAYRAVHSQGMPNAIRRMVQHREYMDSERLYTGRYEPNR